MADIIEGVVIDIVDGEVLELEVDRVEAESGQPYSAHELVRVTEQREATRRAADDDEAAALMALTYENRRVRCFVEQRDEVGRIIGEVEVLGEGQPDPLYGVSDDDVRAQPRRTAVDE